MVEAVLLPEAASGLGLSVDLRRLPMLPAFALLEHRLDIAKRRQQVDVIGHHDEVGQLVAVAVKLPQAP